MRPSQSLLPNAQWSGIFGEKRKFWDKIVSRKTALQRQEG